MLLNGMQVVRVRSVPSNPKTAQQTLARGNLKLASKAWDTLTQEQMLAWSAYGKTQMCRTRLGMNRPLTGNQAYVLVNAALLELNAAQVDAPPGAAEFAQPTCGTPTITSNGQGEVQSFEFVSTAANPAGYSFYAAAPVKPGVFRAPQLVRVGTLPAAANNRVSVQDLYSTRFGNVAVGDKVFMALRQNVGGLWGPYTPFDAIATNE